LLPVLRDPGLISRGVLYETGILLLACLATTTYLRMLLLKVIVLFITLKVSADNYEESKSPSALKAILKRALRTPTRFVKYGQILQ
jgi:hypothetical protein